MKFDTTMTPHRPLRIRIMSRFSRLRKGITGLKILSFLYRGVPVQVRPEAPFLVKSYVYELSPHLGALANRSQKEPFGALTDTTVTPLNMRRARPSMDQTPSILSIYLRNQNQIFNSRQITFGGIGASYNCQL